MKIFHKLSFITLLFSIVQADIPEDKRLDSNHQHYEYVRKCSKDYSTQCVYVLRIYFNTDMSSCNAVGNTLRTNGGVAALEPKIVDDTTDSQFISQLQQGTPVYTAHKKSYKTSYTNYTTGGTQYSSGEQHVAMVEIPLDKPWITDTAKLRAIGRQFCNVEQHAFWSMMKGINFAQQYKALNGNPEKQDRLLDAMYDTQLQEPTDPMLKVIRQVNINERSALPSREEYKKEIKKAWECAKDNDTPERNARFYLYYYASMFMGRAQQFTRYLEDKTSEMEEGARKSAFEKTRDCVHGMEQRMFIAANGLGDRLKEQEK